MNTKKIKVSYLPLFLCLISIVTVNVYASLPIDPYPYGFMPIKSRFPEEILEPFSLLGVWNDPNYPTIPEANMSWENGYLRYESYNWSWVVTRAPIQHRTFIKWEFKVVNDTKIVFEAWNGLHGYISHACMIVFYEGKIYHPQWTGGSPSSGGFSTLIYLCDFNVNTGDFINLTAIVNYDTFETEELYINDLYFSHIPMNNEWIGDIPYEYWQFEACFIPFGYGTVLLRNVEAHSLVYSPHVSSFSEDLRNMFLPFLIIIGMLGICFGFLMGGKR